MTIDEAIAHAKETADTRTDLCDKCREEHRQLAEWLKELKLLRADYEKQKSINYELVEENQEFVNENKELKRLIKLAAEDIGKHSFCSMCENLNDNSKCKKCKAITLDNFKWKHAEEALKLLGDDADA